MRAKTPLPSKEGGSSLVRIEAVPGFPVQDRTLAARVPEETACPPSPSRAPLYG